jgi:uncharacterized protein YacL
MENLDKTIAQRDATISPLAEDVAADSAPEKRTFDDLPKHERVERTFFILIGLIVAMVLAGWAEFYVITFLLIFASFIAAIIMISVMFGGKVSSKKDDELRRARIFDEDDFLPSNPTDPRSPFFYQHHPSNRE